MVPRTGKEFSLTLLSRTGNITMFVTGMDIKIRTNIHSDLLDMFVATFVKIDGEVSVWRGTDKHFVQKPLFELKGLQNRYSY